MKKLILRFALFLFVFLMPLSSFAQTIDVLIKGIDNGVKTSRDQDYKEAVMNAKLQAIERAGVAVQSMTKIENFILKFDMVESQANAVLLPGFQIVDMGYQQDGTYQVVLSGKVQADGAKEGKLWGKLRVEPREFGKFKDAYDLWSTVLVSNVENQFVNNEDGTITDLKTGLMWLRSYDIKETILECRQSVAELNGKKFAGHEDWRVPTLEEIAAIVETKPSAKLDSGRESYLDAVFDARPYCWYLWSADRTPDGYLLAYIGEKRGGIALVGDHYQKDGICVACLKAVRSIK
ncbi:MAG: DUF1566 domain-containing protein [Deltaproteobacteria bacterium]|nr:DUF1566 domain-containing protein [Deltaproteobacteria bacterium]